MSTNIELVRYSPKDAPQWDDMISRSDAGCLLFLRSYMDYHADRFTDVSLMALSQGQIIGCFPASISGKTVTSHGGLTFGGWQVSGACPDETLKHLSDATLGYYKAMGAEKLTVNEMPGIFSEPTSCFGPMKTPDVVREMDGSAVDLTIPHALIKLRARCVKKAMESHNFTDAKLEEFWPILEAVLAERHDAKPTHTLAEITMLRQRLPDRIACFKAELDGKMVAGVVVYLSRKVAHVQYMATDQDGRKSHALDGLIVWLMKLYEGRARWLSLGISNHRDGTLNQGLFDYKLSFGAKRVAHVSKTFTLS